MAKDIVNINIAFSRREFERLEQAKKNSESNTWHDFVLRECTKHEKRHHNEN